MSMLIQHLFPAARPQFADDICVVRTSTGRIEWTQSMDALLGTDLDKNIGLQLGLSTAAVLRRRQSLGIISVKEAKSNAARANTEECRPKHFWSNISSPFMAAIAADY